MGRGGVCPQSTLSEQRDETRPILGHSDSTLSERTLRGRKRLSLFCRRDQHVELEWRKAAALAAGTLWDGGTGPRCDQERPGRWPVACETLLCQCRLVEAQCSCLQCPLGHETKGLAPSLVVESP